MKIKQIKIGKYKIPDYLQGLKVDKDNALANLEYSYSLFMSFCRNPLLAKVKYINKDIVDTTTSASMVLGKALHFGIETYLGKIDGEVGMEDLTSAERIAIGLQYGLNYIQNYAEGFITYTKTIPDKGVMAQYFAYAYQEYVKYLETVNIQIEEIWGIEEKTSASIYAGEKKLPISVKGIIDLVYERDGKVIVIDHKLTSRFSDDDKLDGSKLIQAGFYYFLALKQTGKAPHKIVFNEVKYTENKDKTVPQVRAFELIYENNASLFELFFRLYYDITRMIFEEKAVYLPNVADMYDSDLALITYINRLDTDDKDKIFNKNQVDNITDFLRKEVVKKGADKIYKNTLQSFISSNDIINTKNMNTQEIIKLRFAQHGVALNYIDTIKGLAVDLMRFDVGIGVKLSKLHSFLPDIEMAVGKSGARILAPIPNTQYIGVEVPKTKRSFIKEKPTGSGYDVELGKDLYGEVIRFDLRTAPHILIGGASGSGKTYFLQSIAKQIVNSDDCELTILDPKQIDFQEFDGLASVITEKEDIENFMFDLVVEMESRYKILKEKKKKSIDGTKLKYKFVIIDEYSDLVMGKGGKDVADNVKRIAQKGRACGIHLILATQRPSVKVIDGDIKTNFPIRIAFRLPKAVDSVVVLGDEGAEKLLGKGDGLVGGLDGGSVNRFQAFSHF